VYELAKWNNPMKPLTYTCGLYLGYPKTVVFFGTFLKHPPNSRNLKKWKTEAVNKIRVFFFIISKERIYIALKE
jgi:hypothetical protein